MRPANKIFTDHEIDRLMIEIAGILEIDHVIEILLIGGGAMLESMFDITVYFKDQIEEIAEMRLSNITNAKS